MEAPKEKMLSGSANEMLKSIPGFFGIHLEERAEYTVDRKLDDLEIRRYAPCTMASVTVMGDYESAREAAFIKLANYIHGKNEKQLKTEMTTPVWITALDGGWTMSFFMPKDIGATAPNPTDPDIRLERFGERTFAVMTYSGNASEDLLEGELNFLVHRLSKHPELMPQGRLISAQYDQPFAIPFLKTNEALIELRLTGREFLYHSQC